MRQFYLNLLYVQLSLLLEKNNGYAFLNAPYPQLPPKGVYFFFEEGITRSSDEQLKIMRVGTHSTINENVITLKSRLNQHKGNIGNGGGNHRGSVFRKHVGAALINNLGLIAYPNWGVGNNAPAVVRLAEHPHEISTSNTIRKYPYTYLKVPTFDNRSFIEKCSIELLSNSNAPILIDVPPDNWLGFSSPTPSIVKSQLWNVHYVNNYQPDNNERYNIFLKLLSELVQNH